MNLKGQQDLKMIVINKIIKVKKVVKEKKVQKKDLLE